MSAKFSDELLSAYFDGETSPEEDALVEQALEDSTELRRRLDEVGLVSELLRSLPKETAPPELPAAVRKQIERELLLPAPTAAKSRWSRIRSGWAVACGAAVSVIAIVLIVWAGAPARYEAFPFAASRQESADMASGEVFAKAAASPAGAQEDADQAMAQSRSSDVPVESRGSADSASQENRTLGPPRPNTRFEGGHIPSDRASARPLPSRGEFAEDVKVGNLKPGDVVRYLETSGDEVTVLEVTVIDVQQALGALQVLFAKNAIASDTEPEAPAEQAAGRGANRLHAVYVEATDDQLASTLNAMTHPDIFVEIKRHSTVTIEELQAAQENESARRQFAQLQSRRARGGALPKPSASNDAADASTKPADSQRENDAESPAAPQLASTDADSTERSPADSKSQDDGHSFQLLVTLPTETLEESARRSGGGRRTTPSAKSDKSQDSSISQPLVARSTPAGKSSAEQQFAPRRVVFVLHALHP